MARVPLPRAQHDAARVTDLPFDLHGASWKRTGALPAPGDTPATPAAYVHAMFGDDARRLANGSYGTTFTLRVTPAACATLRRLCSTLSDVLELALPAAGSTVILKVAAQRKTKQSWEDFVGLNTREASAHVHVWKSRPVTVGHPCRVSLAARKYVPRFYAFGIDRAACVCITCMQHIARARPLSAIKTGVSVELYQNLERALMALWLSGCDHCDMHLDNVLVTGKSRVRIIDFGFAVRIPEAMRLQFLAAARLPAAALPGRAEALTVRYANAVQFKRFGSRLPFYTPSYTALAILRGRMSPVDRESVVRRVPLVCAWLR